MPEAAPTIIRSVAREANVSEHPGRGLTASLAVLGALLVTLLATRWLPGLPHEDLVDAALQSVAMLAAAGVAVLAAGRHSDPWPPLLLAAGIAAHGIGDILWYGQAFLLGNHPPFPSWPDAPYLLSYVFLITGVIGLLRAEVDDAGMHGWLDATVVGLGIASVTSAFLFEPVLASLGGDTVAAMIGLAYPVLDLVILGTVAGGIALRGRRPSHRWTAIATGAALFTVGDLVYLGQEASGTYVPGGLLDLTWLVGAILIALAALDRRSSAHVRHARSGVMLVGPAALSLGALTVLVTASDRAVPNVAVGLAVATLLAALWRIGLAFSDVASLHERRHREARTDELTGLANRRAFHEQLADLLTQHGAEERVALLLIDLDHFKEINDSVGHSVGDELLRQIGPRMRPVVRESDLMVRLGGDEFAVVLRGVSGEDARRTALRLREELRRPFPHDDLLLHIDGSVGIAVYPEDGETPELLLQRADVAMYLAKEARSGVELYHAERDVHGRDRLQLLDDLRSALREGQLLLDYQPKWSLTEDRVVGAEALVRWRHPVDGLIPPDRFLPLVERTGLMNELTRRVLEMATEQCRNWLDEGLDLPVAVNVSAVSFLDESLVDLIEQELDRHDLEPRLLLLEVTEHALIVDPARAADVLQRLRSVGVRASVDDYGTGYSSLAYLRDLPIDELKLDRSFLEASTRSERGAAIVRSTIELAHSLGLEMVAEGVEDERTFAALEANGCDIVQGYFVSRPLPASQVADWVRCAPPRLARIARTALEP